MGAECVTSMSVVKPYTCFEMGLKFKNWFEYIIIPKNLLKQIYWNQITEAPDHKETKTLLWLCIVIK